MGWCCYFAARLFRICICSLIHPFVRMFSITYSVQFRFPSRDNLLRHSIISIFFLFDVFWLHPFILPLHLASLSINFLFQITSFPVSIFIFSISIQIICIISLCRLSFPPFSLRKTSQTNSSSPSSSDSTVISSLRAHFRSLLIVPSDLRRSFIT